MTKEERYFKVISYLTDVLLKYIIL